MKNLLFLILLFLFIPNYAQNITQSKIVVLPIVSNGIEYSTSKTAEAILRLELSKFSNVEIISEKKTYEIVSEGECTEEECAIELGSKLNSDESLICKLNSLGDKVIVQYILIDVKSAKKILIEQATSSNIGDLETVMKRVAISVANKNSFKENVQIGNIVAKESEEVLRRNSRYNFGVDFGYLFPTSGHDNEIKVFSLNAYFDHEIENYAVGLMAGARNGFAMNIYGNYLFSPTDICPYVGTSLGFHWVQHDYFDNYDEFGIYQNKELDSHGIELGFKTGIRVLHTYNVQLFINFEYIITFNDYNDKAFVFTIGIL
ncbi:MAG: hypothetical protein IPM32_08450 [Ignavibacteriae bacterium]|nr:hypothetical protein [Ignavibacteriota bacterium]